MHGYSQECLVNLQAMLIKSTQKMLESSILILEYTARQCQVTSELYTVATSYSIMHV